LGQIKTSHGIVVGSEGYVLKCEKERRERREHNGGGKEEKRAQAGKKKKKPRNST